MNIPQIFYDFCDQFYQGITIEYGGDIVACMAAVFASYPPNDQATLKAFLLEGLSTDKRRSEINRAWRQSKSDIGFSGAGAAAAIEVALTEIEKLELSKKQPADRHTKSHHSK